MTELPRVGRTKRQREAAAKQIQAMPEDLREAVTVALEAVWKQEDREIRKYGDDLRSRITVGARVPRELADRIRSAAAAQDISVYSWVMAAYTAKLAEDERPPWI